MPAFNYQKYYKGNMGTYLAQPITSKQINEGYTQNNQLKFSCCQMQGWRRDMEDSTITRHQLQDGNSLFAVFDGHGGFQVSKYVQQNFEEVLTSSQEYKQQKYVEALLMTFHRIDQMLFNNSGERRLQEIHQQGLRFHQQKSVQVKLKPKKQRKSSISDNLFSRNDSSKQESKKRVHTFSDTISHEQQINNLNSPTTNIKNTTQEKRIGYRAGCTANVTLITKTHYYIANTGDSRAIICRKGKSHPLSFDHKPQNQQQNQRITKAGQRIIKGRINGGLNLSRSFGDFTYKTLKNIPRCQQPVICLPDIRIVQRNINDQFILIGCDGVFEKYCDDEQSLANLIRKDRKKAKKGVQILPKIFDKLIAKDTSQQLGCDNMSAILIEFLK